MANYNNGKIYRIVCNKTSLCYVGSTTYDTLAQRLCAHKSAHKKWLIDTKKKCSSFLVLENGDYDIVLIENVKCNSKDELHRRERYWIENMECVNKQIPTRTHAEYRETHQEQINNYNKKYYDDNREREILRNKVYYESNPEKMKENYRKVCEKESILCACGKYYTYKHKTRHMATQQHLDNI